MASEPFLILLEERHGDMKQPLFRNQSDLARRIIEHEQSRFSADSFATVRTQINQALKPGWDRNSRPLPENLREAIMDLVRGCVQDHPEIEANVLEDRLLKAFADNRKIKKKPTAVIDRRAVFEEMIEAMSRSRQCLLLGVPVWEFSNRGQGEAFFDSLAQLLCEDSAEGDERQVGGARCVFFAAGRGEGDTFWRLLRASLERNLAFRSRSEFEVAGRLGQISRQEMRIFTTPPEFCFWPMVVLNPRDFESRAYLLADWSSKASAEVRVLDLARYEQWNKQVLTRLLDLRAAGELTLQEIEGQGSRAAGIQW